MNRNLIQINNKYGAVSDENGEIKVIKKENSDCDFEDILIKENDLDYLKKRLGMEKRHLEEVKNNSKYGNIFNAFILVAEIILFLVVSSTLPMSTTIICMLLFYICSKVPNIGLFGTRFTRYMKKKRLNERIKEIEEKLPELERELQTLKENAKYSVDYKTYSDETALDHSHEFFHNLSEYAIDEQEETPIVVKDLSLTRKK